LQCHEKATQFFDALSADTCHLARVKEEADFLKRIIEWKGNDPQRGTLLMRKTYWHKVAQILVIACVLVPSLAFAAEIGSDQWKSQVGTWSFSDTAIKNTDTGSSNTNAYAAVAQSGEILTYEWTVKFVSTTFSMGPAAGMHILADDATASNRGNSYLVFQDQNFIRLYRAAAGSLPKVGDLATPAVSAGDTFSYKVVFNTRTGLMEIFRNNELMGTYTDSAPFKSGSHISLRTNGTVAEFSQIKVTQK
jgi:hypothetical protein